MTEIFFAKNSEEEDELSKELSLHDAFYINRLSLGDQYIESQQYLQIVNKHAYEIEAPLVVTGPSGSGKSALLANWLKNHLSKPQDGKTIVAYHFVASTAQNAKGKLMLILYNAEYFPNSILVTVSKS